MNENNQGDKNLFEMLEEKSPDYQAQTNSKTYTDFFQCNDEEHKFEFLVQDMFLDHFFP